MRLYHGCVRLRRGFNCGHFESYRTQLCDKHMANGNWELCGNLGSNLNKVVHHDCDRCAGQTRRQPGPETKPKSSKLTISDRGCAGVEAKFRCGHTQTYVTYFCAQRTHLNWLHCPRLSLTSDHIYGLDCNECAEDATGFKTPPDPDGDEEAERMVENDRKAN